MKSLAIHAGWLALAAVLGALGCNGSAPPLPPPEPLPGERATYVIGVPDQLQVSVWKNPELSISAVVRSDGKISVPLLDDVQAEGLTAEELKEVLTTELSEFIQAPDVTVIVLAMNSKTATLMGPGVGRSTLVPLQRPTRVLDAIAANGGFTTFAKKNRVRIIRPTADGGMTEYNFSYKGYLNGDLKSNILLEPGDTIVVPD